MQVLETVESSTAAGAQAQAQAQAQSESEKIAKGVSTDKNKQGGSKNFSSKNGVATISNNDDNSRVSRLD